MQLPCIHKRVREMEHELFWSELKPSVDGSLVSDIIRSSSSGLNSHRATAMELVLQRSIEERRERVFTKVKNTLRSDPAPQTKIEVSNTPAPQVQPPAPATALQPPSKSLPGDTAGCVTSLPSVSTKYEASRDSPAPSKPAKSANKIKEVALREEPPADTKTKASPSEDVVQLVCRYCHIKQSRSDLRSGVHCSLCFWPSQMKCVGCGIFRVGDFEACTSCRRKFE